MPDPETPQAERPEGGALRWTDNREARRWEVFDGDEVVAFAEYRTQPGRMIFTHTVVEPAYEGRGIGSSLARLVLDDAVKRELRIVPICPFIRAYVERHPAYSAHVEMPERPR